MYTVYINITLLLHFICFLKFLINIIKNIETNRKMEDKSSGVADLIILDYLKQHSNDKIVNAFVKGKKIDVKPYKAKHDVFITELLKHHDIQYP